MLDSNTDLKYQMKDYLNKFNILNLELYRKINSIECTVKKEGYRQIKAEYVYCLTCDPDQKEKICKKCAEACHNDHSLTKSSVSIGACHCGLNNHKNNEIYIGNEENNQYKCVFTEWALNSDLFYKSKDSHKIYCMFCAINCIKDNSKLIEFKKESDYHICECNSPVHNDGKKLIKLIGNTRAYNLSLKGYYNQTQIINLIFKSSNSFNKTFISFVKGLESISSIVNNPSYNIGELLNLQGFTWSLQAISNLACSSVDFAHHFSIKLLKDFFSKNFLFTILDFNFDFSQINIISSLLDFIKIYYEIIFKNTINKVPKITVTDIANLDPLQRILISSNIKYIDSIIQEFKSMTEENIIDKIINTLQRYNKVLNSNSKKAIIFLVIAQLLKLMHFFSSYNLINHEQLIKFTHYTDDFIYSFYKAFPEEKMNLDISSKVLKCFNIITEILTYSTYYYNDQIIINYLNESKDQNLKSNDNDKSNNSSNSTDFRFFHYDCEISTNINRNIISLLNILKNIEVNINTEKLLGMIVEKLHFIYSISFKTSETYINSFKRLINSEKALLHKFICDIYNQKELSLLSSLRNIESNIHDVFDKFFYKKNCTYKLKNYEIDCNQLVVNILQELNIFYKYEENFSINIDHNYYNSESHSSIRNELSEKINNSFDDNIINKLTNCPVDFLLYNCKENPDKTNKDKLNNQFQYNNFNNDSSNNLNNNNNNSHRHNNNKYNITKTLVSNSHHILSLSDDKINKQLLNRTFIIFHLMKIIKIDHMHSYKKHSKSQSKKYATLGISRTNIDKAVLTDNNINTESQENEVYYELVNNIKIILYYFVEDEPSNCLILLNDEFYEFLLCIENSQIYPFIQILYYCFISIYKNNYILSEALIIFNLIKTLLKKLSMGLNSKSTKKSYHINNDDDMDIKSENTSKSRDPTEYIEETILVLKIVKILTEIEWTNSQEHENELSEVFREIYDIYNKVFREVLSEIKNQNNSTVNNLKTNNNNNEEALNLKDNQDNDNFTIEEEKESIYSKKIFILFVSFLELINNQFKGDLSIEELDFLCNILTTDDITKFLQIKNLDLKFRIEILKFFKLIYIEVNIDMNKVQSYRTIIINNVDLDNTDDKFSEGVMLKFMKDLMNVNHALDNLVIESSVIKHELKFFNEIIKFANQSNSELVFDYLNNGIIIPMYLFTQKFISIIYLMDGYENLKLYEIVIYFIHLKKYLILNKFNQQELENEENSATNKTLPLVKLDAFSQLYNKFIMKKSVKKLGIILDKFDLKDIDEINKDLEIMTDKQFEVLNYRTVYKFFLKHLKTFFEIPERKSIEEVFKKNFSPLSSFELKQIKKQLINESLLGKTRYENKVFDLIMSYQNIKADLATNSFITNLSEQNLQFSTSNRILMVKSIFYFTAVKPISDSYIFSSLWDIFKILQVETVPTQVEIFKIFEKNSNDINLHLFGNLFLMNLLSIIFNSYNIENYQYSKNYFFACNTIKFMKFLCEEHNEHFQRIFFRELIFIFSNQIVDDEGNVLKEDAEISLFNFILCILGKIILLSGWVRDSNYISSEPIYYYDIFNLIIEFCIEMIQGTSYDNLSTLIPYENDPEDSFLYEFLIIVKPLIVKIPDHEVISKACFDIISLIISFLEEKNTPNFIITLILKVINPSEISLALLKKMRKIYKERKLDGKDNEENEVLIVFDNDVRDYFNTLFFEDKDFYDSDLNFQISNRLFQYLKLASEQYKSEEAMKITNITKAKKESEVRKILKEKRYDVKNISHSSDFFIEEETYFLVSFFDKITKLIEINQNNSSTLVIYTLNPLLVHLSENSKDKFIQGVNRENRYTKLFELMEFSEYFFMEIEYNYIRAKESKFLKWLTGLNYFYLEWAFAFITFSINLIMVTCLHYLPKSEITSSRILSQSKIHNDLLTSISNYSNYLLYNTTTRSLQDDQLSNYTFDSSQINNGESVYYSSARSSSNLIFDSDSDTNDIFLLIITLLGIISIICNFITIVLWFYSRFKLYYKIEYKKFQLNLKKSNEYETDRELSFIERFEVAVINVILQKNEVCMFFLNFICSTIAVIKLEYHCFFGFQILTLINLSPILKNIISAMCNRGIQLINVFIFMQLIIYLHAVIAFFILNEDFLHMFTIREVSLYMFILYFRIILEYLL